MRDMDLKLLTEVGKILPAQQTREEPAVEEQPETNNRRKKK